MLSLMPLILATPEKQFLRNVSIKNWKLANIAEANHGLTNRRNIMQELNFEEITIVSGGKCAGRKYDIVPEAQSDWGTRANDASNALGELGSSLGIAIYDFFH